MLCLRFRNAGMNLQDGHPCVELGVDFKLFVPVFRIVDEAAVVVDVDAGSGKRGIVGRIECAETRGADLGAPVSPEEFGIEAYTYLRDDCPSLGVPGRGDFHRRDEVFLSVRARPAYGELAPGEDDRLVEIVQHKTQG